MSFLMGTVPGWPGLTVIIGAPVTLMLICCAANTAISRTRAAKRGAAAMFILALLMSGRVSLISINGRRDEPRSQWRSIFGRMSTRQSLLPMPKYMSRLGPCQAPSLIWNRYRHDQDGRLMENFVSGIGPYLSWYNMGSCGEPISPETFFQSIGKAVNSGPAARYDPGGKMSIRSCL